MTLTVCWLKNMKGLVVEYVGTVPLRVMKGSSLMACVGLKACAVLDCVGVPLKQDCVPAWLV